MNLRNVIEKYLPYNEQEAEDRRMLLNYLDMFPDILLRTNETAHFSASAWVTNPTHDRVLMIWHNIYQSWSWPGGHADGEENLLNVALREVTEETGVKNVRPVSENVFSVEILTVNAHFKCGKYVVPHLHLNLTYLLEADEAQALRVKADENSGVKWFGLDEAVSVCCEPDMKIVYAKLNEKLRMLQ